MIDDLQLREAIDRIAGTADGQLLYRYCQKVLCGVSNDPNDSALREDNGRRRFASELMGLMAKGIEGSDRTAITFSRNTSERTERTGPRGAGRRVTADTHVAGWDSPGPGGTDAPGVHS